MLSIYSRRDVASILRASDVGARVIPYDGTGKCKSLYIVTLDIISNPSEQQSQIQCRTQSQLNQVSNSTRRNDNPRTKQHEIRYKIPQLNDEIGNKTQLKFQPSTQTDYHPFLISSLSVAMKFRRDYACSIPLRFRFYFKFRFVFASTPASAPYSTYILPNKDQFSCPPQCDAVFARMK